MCLTALTKYPENCISEKSSVKTESTQLINIVIPDDAAFENGHDGDDELELPSDSDGDEFCDTLDLPQQLTVSPTCGQLWACALGCTPSHHR